MLPYVLGLVVMALIAERVKVARHYQGCANSRLAIRIICRIYPTERTTHISWKY